MKVITVEQLLEMGYKPYTCNDGDSGFIRDNVIYIDATQIMMRSHKAERLILFPWDSYKINTPERLQALHFGLTGKRVRLPYPGGKKRSWFKRLLNIKG